MIACTFTLNGEPLSKLEVQGISVPAFSGRGSNINNRAAACIAGSGPIPPGTYYIFDRQGGGLLEPFRNLFSDHSQWFALYAVDARIDDEAFCASVKRGNFRLHPKGPRGISEGCITVDEPRDFQRIRMMLKSLAPTAVPGCDLKAYGRVTVK